MLNDPHVNFPLVQTHWHTNILVTQIIANCTSLATNILKIVKKFYSYLSYLINR